MKKERGITLVSLVVTIIVLIILAGVSINLTLGENGIITKAKQAKEKTEQSKLNEEIALNELYTQMESENSSISYDSIAKLTEFKKSIANYIEEAGGTKPEYTDDAITFGESIKGIVKEVTKNATATAEDIADGKTAWVNGNLITGTFSNNLNVQKKYIAANRSYTFEKMPNFVLITNQSINISETNSSILNISMPNYKSALIFIKGIGFIRTDGYSFASASISNNTMTWTVNGSSSYQPGNCYIYYSL